MSQLQFAFAVAPSPPCRFGCQAWDGPHHCASCAAAVEAACRQFDAAVQAGTYNARGYRQSEWIRAGHPAATWRD
jgi:hypothetical protein